MMHARKGHGSLEYSLMRAKSGWRDKLNLGVVLAKGIVLVDVGLALPGVGEPDVGGVDSREVLDVRGDLADLGLEPGGVSRYQRRLHSLVVDNEDGELGLGTELLTLSDVLNLGELLVDVLLELVDGVHQGGARVVDLVNDQHAAAEETTVVELVAELRVRTETYECCSYSQSRSRSTGHG